MAFLAAQAVVLNSKSHMDSGSYCCEVESYLCRKNGGHLIRIVGPAFQLVKGWGGGGVPLSIVCRAVDRAYSRYQAKGERHYPLRIEYCENDVKDLFEEWKRAVGIESVRNSSENKECERNSEVNHGRKSLDAHLERVGGRLAQWNREDVATELKATVSNILDEVRTLGAEVKSVSSGERNHIIEQLKTLDLNLLDAVRRTADGRLQSRLREEAEREVNSFRKRMAPATFHSVVSSSIDRLLIEYFKLPRISYE